MSLTARADVLRAAAQLYRGRSFGDRLQRMRPFICPFEELMSFVPAGSRVLDIGCGSGLLLGLLAIDDRLARGVGVDPSQSAIARAEVMRDTLSFREQNALSFVVGTLAELSAEEFGVVAMVDVMHHIAPSQQRAAFLEAASRVACGGVLLYKDLSSAPWWRAQANRAHDLALSRQWVHYVNSRDLAEWITASGLTKECELNLPRLWYAHHAVVLRRS